MEAINKATYDGQLHGNILVVGKTVWKNMLPVKTSSKQIF